MDRRLKSLRNKFRDRDSFICVNYNGAHFTKELLESLESMNSVDGSCIRLVVVDNNSDSSDQRHLKDIKSSSVEIKMIFSGPELLTS